MYYFAIIGSFTFKLYISEGVFKYFKSNHFSINIKYNSVYSIQTECFSMFLYWLKIIMKHCVLSYTLCQRKNDE